MYYWTVKWLMRKTTGLVVDFCMAWLYRDRLNLVSFVRWMILVKSNRGGNRISSWEGFAMCLICVKPNERVICGVCKVFFGE